ncbi:MAG: hypothetical protein NVS1B11_21770 [Terriglobales bacterium]
MPGNLSLNIPKAVRSTDLGSNCHAIAVLGCQMAEIVIIQAEDSDIVPCPALPATPSGPSEA